jgi:hypothetical protein
MADMSPRAVAFREAWQKAVEEDGRLEPLPEGVRGEEQRERIVAAFERAIACMPEAPPCPSLLIRIGQLWNSPAVAPEQPDKALKAYERVEKEYPTAQKFVVQALAGEAYSYWLLGQPAKAAQEAQQVLNYKLPENAGAELVSFVSGIKEEMKLQLRSYTGYAVARWDSVDTSPILSALGAGQQNLSFPTVAARVATASAVVRCEMVEVTDSALVCKVTRVLYGRIPGQTLRLESWVRNAKQLLKADLGREPTQEEVRLKALEGFALSRNVILFVDQVREYQGVVVCQDVGASFDAPPQHPLDDGEKQILDVVKSGAYLTPAPTPAAISPYARSSKQILKAGLTAIGETTMEWRITSVLYAAPEGKLESVPPISAGATIKVGLGPWRLRAESVVRSRAAGQDTGGPAEDEVKNEFDRLVGNELKLGGEAILFVRVGESEGDDVVWKLVGIAREDPATPGRLVDYEKAIRDMLNKGLMNTEYL